MSFKRNRTTWGRTNRKASAPPAVPGYGAEDQDHPAHTQDDPAYEQYQKGDPSAWAEDPHQGPYLEGNPPAVPGYDSEDQDHPAHKRHPRVRREAALGDQIKRKAAKCLVLARHMLGKNASQEMIENQALDMMDHSDSYINSSLQRVNAGGFLAMDDDMFLGMDDDDWDDGDDWDDEDDGFMAMGDEDVNSDSFLGMEDEMFGMDEDLDDMMATMRHMAAEVRSLKAQLRAADQNDPKGETLDPDTKSEEELRSEGAGKSASSRVASYFVSHGGGSDGFAMADEWRGSKALFAALDTDGDGIITSDELKSAMFDPSDELMAMADEFLEDEVDMMNACGEMVLAGEVPEAFKKQWEKKDDDKDDGKKEDKKAADDSDEDEDGADKEASLFGGPGHDPMGLSGGDSVHLSSEQEALLTEIFSEGLPGHTASDEDLGLNPQPRQASTGVTSLGNQTRTASDNSANSLEALWKTAPDVSKVFGL